jgi:peptidoglycan/LPS O-acetylase OafA/YrhL
MERQMHRFAVLDGMRGLAAFVVIADHVPAPTIGPLTPGRYLAVDFFFVLSGFVLAHAYGRRLEAGFSPAAFLKARLIRLYPLYVAGLCLGALLALLHMQEAWIHGNILKVLVVFTLGLFFIPCPPSFLPPDMALFPFDGPAWSLFFELAVNAVYAVFAAQLFGIRLGALLAFAAALLAVLAVSSGTLDGGWKWPNFSAGAARVAFSFFAGVAIYRLWSRRNLPGLHPAFAFAILAIVFAVPAEGAWRPVFDATAALVIFPALVALSANSAPSEGAKRIFLTMGMLSYGVYVLHVPIYHLLRMGAGAIFHTQLEALGDGAILLVLIGAAAATSVAHVFYDVPVRRWLTRQMPFQDASRELNSQQHTTNAEA